MTDHVVPSPPIVPLLGELVVPGGKSVRPSPSSVLDFGRSGPALTSVVVSNSDVEHLQTLTPAPDHSYSLFTLSSPMSMTEPLSSLVSANVPLEPTTSSPSLVPVVDHLPLALCSSPSSNQ